MSPKTNDSLKNDNQCLYGGIMSKGSIINEVKLMSCNNQNNTQLKRSAQAYHC